MMELHFTKTNEAADIAIEDLIELVDGIQERDLVREMILAALKAGQESTDRAHMKLMNTTMKEMRFTSKIFSPYRHKRKVTVFGSARTRPDEPIYDMARQFGNKLTGAGYMVITGAGAGIMHAVNEGAGPEHSFGVNITLPFEQAPNPILVGNPRLITYKYFFNRKVAFLKEADAVALFPGGFGTLDEAMETLTLLQNGKNAPLPLVLIEKPGGSYWKRWVRFMKEELLSEGYINKDDFDLFKCVDSVDEALKHINHFYSRYHSMRYIGNKLVFRLTSSISPADIAGLNKDFADILVRDGKLETTDTLPEESDEPEIMDLPRLAVDFNRRDFGRLRHLIDHINDLYPRA